MKSLYHAKYYAKVIFLRIQKKKQWDNEYNKFIENFSKEDRVEINKNINFATPDILIAINKRLINSHFISLTEAYRKYKMDNELQNNLNLIILGEL